MWGVDTRRKHGVDRALTGSCFVCDAFVMRLWCVRDASMTQEMAVKSGISEDRKICLFMTAMMSYDNRVQS